MSKSEQREVRFKLINDLVVLLTKRKSNFDDYSLDVCYDEATKEQTIQKVYQFDVDIANLIKTIRAKFKPKFHKYTDAEICFVCYMFNSAYDSETPRIVDSKDLNLICLDKMESVCHIVDSFKNGTLYQHIKQSEMYRGNGYEYQIRSITILTKKQGTRQ